MDTTKYAVRLGQGAEQVLCLDDPEICKARGLVVHRCSQREIEVSGTGGALLDLLSDFEYRAECSQWDQPAWYAHSAKSAVRKIKKALEVE